MKSIKIFAFFIFFSLSSMDKKGYFIDLLNDTDEEIIDKDECLEEGGILFPKALQEASLYINAQRDNCEWWRALYEHDDDCVKTNTGNIKKTNNSSADQQKFVHETCLCIKCCNRFLHVQKYLDKRIYGGINCPSCGKITIIEKSIICVSQKEYKEN